MKLGFRWWQPVMSVVVAAGVGVVTNLVTTTPTVPLVVALVALVAVQAVAAWLQGRADLAAARSRRDAALLPLRTIVPPQHGRPLDWLSASVSPTPLWSQLRHTQVDELLRWCEGESAVFRIVSGPAGVGKTRLLIELAARLPTSWVTGQWTGVADVVERITACPERALVVVDDADRAPGIVGLLAAAAQHRRQVRVVLLCRHGKGLAASLRAELPAPLRTLVDADPLELAPIGAGADRQRWFDEAARRYAAAMNVSPPTLPDLATAPPVGDDRDTMLILHARALLAVLNRHHARTLGWPEVAQELFNLEVAHWPTPGGHSKQTRTEVILTLCMFPAFNTGEAVQALRRLQRLRDAPEQTVTELAEWARDLYPPSNTGTLDLRPHLVAEWLIAQHLRDHSYLLDELGDQAIRKLLSTLIRAGTTFPETYVHLDHVIGNNPRWLALAIETTATAIPTRQLDETLSGLIDTTNLDYAQALETSTAPTALPRLRAALNALAVTRYRDLATSNPDRYRADLANSLNNLGISLQELGRRWEALAVEQEALAINRELAASDPDRYRSNLAMTLNNLGIMLKRLGRPREALAADQEALVIRRELAASDPDRYRPDLAQTLNNLGVTLQELGRRREALAVEQEALAIDRELAASDPDHYRPELAESLNNLGVLLRRLGRPREALAADQEALAIYRELAASNPDRYRPDLADSLNNLGISLQDLGRFQEALAVEQEALAIRRELAACNPDRYRPDLAESLNNLGVTLRRLGRPQEALGADQEALPSYRELAAGNPDHYRPDLAVSLYNLGISLSEVGRPQEALAAWYEQVEQLRLCAESDPERYEAHYMRVDAQLRQQLAQSDNRAEAIQPNLSYQPRQTDV